MTASQRLESPMDRLTAITTGLLLGFATASAQPATAQTTGTRPTELPFAIGERLEYRVSTKLGSIGEGVMTVDGPADIRGTTALVLR